jgi:hypothetical protein
MEKGSPRAGIEHSPEFLNPLVHVVPIASSHVELASFGLAFDECQVGADMLDRSLGWSPTEALLEVELAVRAQTIFVLSVLKIFARVFTLFAPVRHLSHSFAEHV